MMNTDHLTANRRVRPAAVALVLFALAWTSACENKDLAQLPPASGEGSPEAVKIPTLAELGKLAPTTQREVGTRAGTGSLQALHYAALGPKETGILTSIAVEEGDRVKKGQVLFKLDGVQFELMVDQAKAAVATAKVQQAAAQLDFDRTKALHARGSVPQDAFDQAKSRLDSINSTILQAQSSVSIAQRRFSNMVVTSPIDGVVSDKRMNVGETATLMPPSVVLVVQDIDALELRARLPETALKTVREGAQINVRFPATDESRTVTIKRIAPTVDARTRTIEIIAEVPNPDHHLKAGMLVEVAYANAEQSAAAAPAVPATTPVARSKKPAEALGEAP